jgi:hypothetical protein
VPGCEGAKVRTTAQEAPPARTDGQLVESVKSPVSEIARGKGCVPVFEIVAVCELADAVVTTTALGKSSEEGVTLRLGLTVEPPAPG